MVNDNKNKCNNSKFLGRRTGVDTEPYSYYFTYCYYNRAILIRLPILALYKLFVD